MIRPVRVACAALAFGLLVGTGIVQPVKTMAAPRRKISDSQIVTDLTRLHVYRATGIAEKRLRVKVEALSGGYARTRVSATDRSLDPAKLYLNKDGPNWEVIAGPGTQFTAAELRRLGVPRAVR